MDKLQEMKVFVAVVDAGSFVGASEALEMSKAAVSRYVKDLELRLGVRLLQRTTRRLSLTGEGEVFCGRCRELLAEVDEAEAEITSRSGEASGVLKINAPVSFGVIHLAGLWAEFMVRNPKLELDITLSDRIVDLVEEGFDVAIRIACQLFSRCSFSRQIEALAQFVARQPQDRLDPHDRVRLPGISAQIRCAAAPGRTGTPQGPRLQPVVGRQ